MKWEHDAPKWDDDPAFDRRDLVALLLCLAFVAGVLVYAVWLLVGGLTSG